MADNNDILTENEKIAFAEQMKKINVPAEEKTSGQIEAEAKAAEEAATALAVKEKIDAEAAEAKRIEDEAAAKLTQQPTGNPIELTDEALVEILEKRTGKKIMSLDDLRDKPSAEDEQRAQEQREADKIAFGLQRGKFNNVEYQNYLTDLKDPSSLVFSQYKAEALAADAELTDAEIEAEFNEKFGLDAEPDSRKFKRGQSEIAALAQGLIANKHKKVFAASSEFETEQAKKQSVREREEVINKGLKTYQSDINEIAAKVQNLSFEVGGEKIDVDIDPKIVSEIVSQMADNDFAANQILSGYKKEGLQELLSSSVYLKSFNSVVVAACEAYLLKKESGLRGLERKDPSRQQEGSTQLTDRESIAFEFLKSRIPQPSAT